MPDSGIRIPTGRIQMRGVDMHPRRYRALLVGTVLSWFLLGLHFPIVHEITEHGRVPHWSVVVAVVVISAAAVVTLWKLLRAPARGAS